LPLTDDDWDRVVFSNETKINRLCYDGRSWCRFRDGQSRSARMVQQTVKFGGGGVMMWGCMPPSGPGMMCRIEGRMDQYMYREILERELIHTLHAYNLDPANLIFQHDNDPKHTSKSVRRWLNLQEFIEVAGAISILESDRTLVGNFKTSTKPMRDLPKEC
jgi:hypothetical protein